MKLKIRVKPKDFIYFVILCIVLFIGCIILAVNFLSLINDGEFAGLNIFKHLNGSAWTLTFLLFLGSIIVIFMSVSNTIFDFEKGKFGLDFSEKEDKGYSRWLTAKEMKKQPNIVKVPVDAPEADAGGIVFINDGKNMWVDNSEYHTLIIGQSGSGKTTALVDPQVYSLAKHGESMVITDPKGEIYRNHANRLKAKGYKIVVINFREPREGNSWNPLTIPYKRYKQGKRDKAKELLEDISLNIIKEEKSSADPFWENSASDYFCALAYGLFEDAKENEVNIKSISDMGTIGEEKNGPMSTFAKDYFTLKGEESAAYQYAKATITSPEDTKKSILSVFQSKIRTFGSREELTEMLSYSDFNMEDIGREKTAVFIIVHDEKTTYHPLATIFVKQLYEVLIDVAHKNPDGKLKYRTNFILDEFSNMPELRDVDSMVTAARSRQIRFTFIIQNYAQLDDVYGDKKAETIRSNCANQVYLLTNELSALEQISKLCGEVKSKDKEKTVSTPLVTVTDLQKMKKNEIIVRRMRLFPFKTLLKGSYEINWGDSYEKATFIERDAYNVKSFDLRQFVKEEKRKKAQEKMREIENDSGDLSLGGRPVPSFGNNPFMNDFSRNELPSSNPFSKLNDKDFDLDEMIRNIDAEIAKLEKEEEEERLRKESLNKQEIKPEVIRDEKPEYTSNKTEIFEEPFIKLNHDGEYVHNKTEIFSEPLIPKEDRVPLYREEKTEIFDAPFVNNKLNIDTSSKIVSNNLVTDDQYFDDFFGDDEE